MGTALRYQIRLGENDLDVMLKNHRGYHYVPYRKVIIDMIDANNEVLEWDLDTKKEELPNTNENGKRGAPNSPEGRPAPKRIVSDGQISEFIWSYLEGTQTSTNYDNQQWELEPIQPEEDKTEDTEAEQESAQEKADEIQ